MRFALLLALTLSFPTLAHAGSADACFAAAVDGQKQRDAGKLLAARGRFIACAKSGCPDEVHKDCAQWLTEVDAALPTVVFGARDGEHDLVDVRVTVDGVAVGDTSQGKAVPLDPGAHAVKFERDGAAPIEQTLVVRAGEKNRRVVADFAPVKRSPEIPASSSVPTATWVLGGAGVVGLSVFAYFGARGVSDYHTFHCDTGCNSSDKSSVDTKLRIADVGLLVGVGSLAAATIVWWVRPKNEPSVGLTIGPVARGTLGALTVSF